MRKELNTKADEKPKPLIYNIIKYDVFNRKKEKYIDDRNIELMILA